MEETCLRLESELVKTRRWQSAHDEFLKLKNEIKATEELQDFLKEPKLSLKNILDRTDDQTKFDELAEEIIELLFALNRKYTIEKRKRENLQEELDNI